MKVFAKALFFSLLASSTLAQIAPNEADLRSAISTGGSVTFTGNGTISLASPLVVARDTTIDGAGQDITIDGVGATRLFEVNLNVHLTLKNLILANGAAKGTNGPTINEPGTAGYGGALRNSGGKVTLVNCTLSNNVAIGGNGFVAPLTHTYYTAPGAAAGGAIWQTGGALMIEGGAFITNRVIGGIGRGSETTRGGAIFSSSGAVSIDGTSFDWNAALGSSSAEGGAVFLDGSANQIKSARFALNGSATTRMTAYGGAISASSGALEIKDSVFSENGVAGGFGPVVRAPSYYDGAPGFGGAIYVGPTATTTVHESSFDGNNARGGLKFGDFEKNGSGFGGAIYVDGSLALINATLYGNYATEGEASPFPAPSSEGGAIYSKGSVAATNITIVNNSATTAALTAVSGAFVIKNSLLAKNSLATASGSITDAGNNLSSTGTPVFTAASSHTVASLAIGPYGDYGGPTPTVPLLAGSPAIDAGDDIAGGPTDQRGRVRPFGSHTDVGAFESSPPFYIFGKLIGYNNGSITATHGAESSKVDAAGNFHFSVAEGSNSFSFASDASADTLFRPNPLVLDVHADMETHVTAFRFQALTFDPDIEAPTITFAGKAGETWEFQVSNNLSQWTPVQTNSFNADGLFSIPLANLGEPVFVKGIKH